MSSSNSSGGGGGPPHSLSPSSSASAPVPAPAPVLVPPKCERVCICLEIFDKSPPRFLTGRTEDNDKEEKVRALEENMRKEKAGEEVEEACRVDEQVKLAGASGSVPDCSYNIKLRCGCKIHYECLIQYIRSKHTNRLSLLGYIGIACPYGSKCLSFLPDIVIRPSTGVEGVGVGVGVEGVGVDGGGGGGVRSLEMLSNGSNSSSGGSYISRNGSDSIDSNVDRVSGTAASMGMIRAAVSSANVVNGSNRSLDTEVDKPAAAVVGGGQEGPTGEDSEEVDQEQSETEQLTEATPPSIISAITRADSEVVVVLDQARHESEAAAEGPGDDDRFYITTEDLDLVLKYGLIDDHLQIDDSNVEELSTSISSLTVLPPQSLPPSSPPSPPAEVPSRRRGAGGLDPILAERLRLAYVAPLEHAEVNAIKGWLLDNRSRSESKFEDVELDPYILAITKACPQCTYRSSHFHGHRCHHISPFTQGCPSCHTNYCYRCLSKESDNIAIRGNASKCLCGFWSNFCIPIHSDEDVEQFIRFRFGIPYDTRCGCSICVDCRFRSPCNSCSGDCGVCLGHLSPSPVETLALISSSPSSATSTASSLSSSTSPSSGGVGTNSSEGERERQVAIKPWQGAIIRSNVTIRFNNSTYVGQTKYGLAHGLGVCSYNSGNVYEGSWFRNQRHGVGTYRFSAGDVYTGDWRMSQRHGNGTFRWHSGDVYNGEWQDDKRTGQGCYSWPSGDIYTGSFLASSLHGWGKFKFSDGDVFEGNVKGGNFDGYGEFNFMSGNVYKGNFKNDKLENGHLFLSEVGETFLAEFSGGDEILNKFRVYDVRLYRVAETTDATTATTAATVATTTMTTVSDAAGSTSADSPNSSSRVSGIGSESSDAQTANKVLFKQGRFSHGRFIVDDIDTK